MTHDRDAKQMQAKPSTRREQSNWVEARRCYEEQLQLVRRPARQAGAIGRLLARLRVPSLKRKLIRAMAAQTIQQNVEVAEELVATYETIFGPDHPALAGYLDRLGCFYREAGNPKAMACYQRAREIAERCYALNDPRRAVILSNLGGMYRQMGMVKKAREYYEQARQIDRLAYGESHPEYATDANNIAVTYMAEEEYEEARRWYEIALNIDLRTYGPWHHVVAQDYSNWAGLLAAMGDYAGAEESCRDSLAILEACWPGLTIRIAQGLIALAGLIKTGGMDRIAEARCLVERALKIDRNVLGEHHPDIASDLLCLAEIEASRGDQKRPMDLISEALSIQEATIGTVLAVTSERERLAFLTQHQPTLDLILSLAGGSPEMIFAAHQLVLRRKGLDLEVTAAQQQATLIGAYPLAKKVFEELREIRLELAHHTLSRPARQSENALRAHDRKLLKLRDRSEEMERALARHVPEVEVQGRLRVVDRQAVAMSLPQGSVLVDFVRFNPCRIAGRESGTRWEAPRYLAFILPAGMPDGVQLMDLGDAEDIDAMVGRFRKDVLAPIGGTGTTQARETADSPVLDSSRELYLRLFLPLRKVVGGGSKQLFLSPDGELNLIPFEALLSEEGRFVAEDHRLSYVASGRDVLRFGQRFGEPRDSVIVADPDFDLCASGTPVQEEDAPVDRKVQPFDQLPSTHVEGENVAKILRKNGVPVCDPWFGRDALEEPLKTVRSPLILHLATHGFFEQDQEHKPDKRLRGLGLTEKGESGFLPGGIENPLLRSGLALAGANALILNKKPAPGAEDGILTALDVCGFHLYGTELVVLSACDTGVGEVRRGEGVFGLRRAFHQAGAKTLVMSLWKVADEETQVLMEQFYSNLLVGMHKSDALREAQLSMIGALRNGTLRPEYGFAHPFFWAAFICQGDPAPIRWKPQQRGNQQR